MTHSSEVLDALVPLIADLARDDLSAELRYRRLLDALRSLLPCDAIALLRLEADALVPVAVHGLSVDTLGRRFQLEAHPRLRALLASPHAMRFPADCALPDPYDGLVEGVEGDLLVHDCMGCVLGVGQTPWGLLTLDAMHAEHFSPADLRVLNAFASLASATVAAMARVQQLTRSVEDERRRADAWRLAGRPDTGLLTGHDPAFQQLMSEIELVAPSDLSVLITGETGVGKELVASRLHALSSRADKVMVTINCAALPENLAESELFGHVRGAFSGAVADRLGKFEAADHGTLFLDEIGELPLNVQAKLLRVLQNGQLQRIGSDRERSVDVRLIAATNRVLADEVKAGRFRADLYHRLSMFPIHVPPLRERRQDILILAGTFLEQNRRRMGMRALRLSPEAKRVLQAHHWPGNVRELEHVLARAALRAKNHAEGRVPRMAVVTLRVEDLDLVAGLEEERVVPPMFEQAHDDRMDFRACVDAFQKRVIEAALQTHQGRLSSAARALGMDRANLARLATRLEIVWSRKH